MEQYSPAELSELFLQAQALIDTQLQYWMSITFAVVVAGFVAGKRLTLRLRCIVGVLYALATFTLLIRTMTTGADAVAIANTLQESGSIIFHTGPSIILSRLLLFGLGTIAALYFLLVSRRASELDR